MEKGQFFIFKMGLKFGPNMIILQIKFVTSLIHFINESNDDVWGPRIVCIYIIYQYEDKVRFMSMLYYLIVEIYVWIYTILTFIGFFEWRHCNYILIFISTSWEKVLHCAFIMNKKIQQVNIHVQITASSEKPTRCN